MAQVSGCTPTERLVRSAGTRNDGEKKIQINFRKTHETRRHRQQNTRHRRAGRRRDATIRTRAAAPKRCSRSPPGPALTEHSGPARPGAAALPAAERSGAALGPGSTAPSRSAPRHRPRAAAAVLGAQCCEKHLEQALSAL